MLGSVRRGLNAKLGARSSLEPISAGEHQTASRSLQVTRNNPSAGLLVNSKAFRRYSIGNVMTKEAQKTIEARPISTRNSFTPRGTQSRQTESPASYDHDNVHLLPDSPPLWVSGEIQRQDFVIFLTDLLASHNYVPATRLYAQLVLQSREAQEYDALESLEDILKGDQLPNGPLPQFSQIELLGVFFSLYKTGLRNHAIQLWRHFDNGVDGVKANENAAKTHSYYYSQAFESAYTENDDVRNVQLLVNVMEAAHEINDAYLVAEIFERLVAGLLPDLEQQKAMKTEIPKTPLWHVSYHRQLRTLELGLLHLDPAKDGRRIITYLNTYRLKFATCWTPKSLLRFYDLLAAVRTQNPDIAEEASVMETKIKKLSYKIATHETLQALRNEPALVRIRSSFGELQYAPASETTLKLLQDEKNAAGISPGHPGVVNLIARAIELSEESTLGNYQLLKQIYLECFELPYFFQAQTTIVDAALKLFANGNDGNAISWLYQRCIEQDIGISVNVRNCLMFWALRKASDTSQCVEFFNDLLVALGPQAANGATILLLLDAIQAKSDLEAALNVLKYVRENLSNWTNLKQALETAFNIALEKKDEAIIKILADEMMVNFPKTYNSRWRPLLVQFVISENSHWDPPTALESPEKGVFF